MQIGKTSVSQEVCLNRQLVLLLQEFEWTGFHTKSSRIVGRMREWLGVKGYSLKNVILNAAAANLPNLMVSQRIAGHISVGNTKRYTQESLIAANLQTTEKMIIPGLH